MMDLKAMVSIPRDEYEELKEAADFLSCLEAAGVDNWDGYSEARQMMRETEEEQ